MIVLAVLVAAQVLTVANSNVIAVALPALSSELGATAVERQWVVDAYVLVFAALLVAGGVVGDRFGRRRALVTGLVVFAVGSLACALVSDPGLLIAARVIQALGPPLVLPSSLSILGAAFTAPRARGRALGVWGAGSGLGIAVGPLVGGIVVDAFGWRWAFGAGVLAAVGLAAAALAVVPSDRPAAPARRFDVAGAVLVTAGLGSLVFALIEGPARGWSAPAVLAAFVAAAVLSVAFVAVERRHPAPLVDLDLVRRPVFAAANLAAGTLMFVMLPTSVYLSEFLQTVRHSSPLEAGLALAPLGAAVALLAGLAGRLTARVPARTLIVTGLVCAGAGTLLLSRVSADDEAGDLWPALAVLGAGAGFAFPATTATAIGAVEAARTGMASAVHNAGRQVGATLGVAVLGSIVTAHAVGSSAAGYADGLSIALLVATGVLLVVAITALALIPSRARRRAAAVT
jgi:MFS transporter, DHA2 family, methylenomycin A resistance protein